MDGGFSLYWHGAGRDWSPLVNYDFSMKCMQKGHRAISRRLRAVSEEMICCACTGVLVPGVFFVPVYPDFVQAMY